MQVSFPGELGNGLTLSREGSRSRVPVLGADTLAEPVMGAARLHHHAISYFTNLQRAAWRCAKGECRQGPRFISLTSLRWIPSSSTRNALRMRHGINLTFHPDVSNPRRAATYHVVQPG